MLRKCKASVMLYKGNTTIEFVADADDEKEILEACGRALAHDAPDAIDVWGIQYEYPESKDPFKKRYIRCDVFTKHDAIFEAMRAA